MEMRRQKLIELTLLVCAALGMTMVASAASAAMGWTPSGWKNTTFTFAVDSRPIGGKLRKTTLTRVNSTTNRTQSRTDDTFHAVSNFCVHPVTGSATEEVSGFVGNANGASLDFKCSGSGTTSFIGGWIWAEQ
jgi:hypothetical protein